MHTTRTLVACDKTISHKCPYQLAFCSVWEYQKWRNVCRFEWCQCAGLLEEVRQTLMTSVDVDFFFSFPIMYYLPLTNRICYIHCDANRWKMFFALLILSNIRIQTYSKLWGLKCRLIHLWLVVDICSSFTTYHSIPYSFGIFVKNFCTISQA